MYFTISKTPRIFVWVQSGPEFCARGPRNIMRANATRTPVGAQSVHSRVAARTLHASMHSPSAPAHRAAPGPPRRSVWLQMARRWRPEMGGKQSEHHGHAGSGHRHVHASGWADLLVRRCSRRSGRSSVPSSEVGTHPRDGQGRALSSARPHGSGERQAQRRG
jgi:hypothetical protein